MDSNFGRRKLQFLILVVALLFMAIWLWWRRKNSAEISDPNSRNHRHFVVISAVYSANSKSYANHSIVLLINAPTHPIAEYTTFWVRTKNATAHQWSQIALKKPFAVVECLWTAYISVANSVEGPNMMEIEYEGTTMPVKVEPSFDAKSVHVGTCFSPLFFAEHWQLIVLSVGIYRHFGANLQVLYLMSAVGGIMELLELYSDVVQIEPWYTIQLDKPDLERMGLDPNLELDWRNQATAHTDCLLKYRESTEFLIVADLDDVLIPADQSTGYYEEFVRDQYPAKNVAAQLYSRFPTEITSTRTASAVSLRDDLHSIKVSLYQPDDPKYVVNTSRVDALWLHGPAIIKDGMSIKRVLVRNGRMLHFRNWTFVGDKRRRLKTANDGDDEQNPAIWSPIPLSDTFLASQKMDEIGAEFGRLFKNNEQKVFRKLPKEQKYTKMFTKCYDRIFYGNDKQVDACPGPHRCRIRPISGLKCQIARRYFHGRQMAPDVFVYTAPNPAKFHRSTSGCSF